MISSCRDSGRFASGMGARKGEDPLAGLQRSLQRGPHGDAWFLRSQRRTILHIFPRPIAEHPQWPSSPVLPF